ERLLVQGQRFLQGALGFSEFVLVKLYRCPRTKEQGELLWILFSFLCERKSAADIRLSLTVALQAPFDFCQLPQRVYERGMIGAHGPFTLGKSLAQQRFAHLRATTEAIQFRKCDDGRQHACVVGAEHLCPDG